MSDENGVEISQEDGARPLSKDIVMLFPTGNVVPSHFDLTNFYHPRQDATTVVLHDNGFFELQRSKLSKYSSWFIDQRVSDSSYLYFSNKIDPRFILLPYLEAAPAKFSPIDQLIHSSPLNADGKTERLPLDRLNEWKMYEICDINDKLGDDMILYRFNKDKTLAWLRNKVDKVANIIATQRTRNLRRNQSLYVDSFNSGSRPVSTAAESLSANYAEVNNDDIKASVEIICDQLTDNMAQALCESYTLSVDEVLVTKAVVNPLKRKADWEVALEVCVSCYFCIVSVVNTC